MRPLSNQTHSSQTSSARITIKTAAKLLAVLLIAVAVPLALYVRVKSEDSARWFSKAENSVAGTKRPKDQVTVHAAGRGKPFLNLQDGRQMSVTFRGDQAAVAAMQNGGAQARALASADFDLNGTPDVVAGYSYNGGGIITVQRGNPDAFAPADDSVFVRMQQGYNPDSLLPGADVYSIPVPADFLVTGNFTKDSAKDVVFAAKGGALYLMEGNGSGRLGEARQINLPGPVTALAAGEFRAADGFTDLAVGVSGPDGDAVLIFDDGADGFANALAEYKLAEPASAIEFGGLDDDSYRDVAVAAGSELLVVHGWGRKEQVATEARVERVNVGPGVRGLALGEFAWDRQGRSEIAALTYDGTVHIVEYGKLDTRPFSDAEAAQRTRGNLRPQKGSAKFDVESAPSWKPAQAGGWKDARQILGSNLSSDLAKPLMRTNLSYREMDEVMVLGRSQSKLEILRPLGKDELAVSPDQALLVTDDTAKISLDVANTPVATLVLPRKLNGVTDVIVLDNSSPDVNIVPNAPNTTITVDRVDDPAGAGLTAASACTAAGNDCSLRGAIEFANLPQNNNTTISLPANTYILSINGTSAGGCDGNAQGDLGANRTMSIVGAGAATTIIRQTGTGPALDGDRVMCMNEPFTLDLVYNFSGFTMVGGRDGTAGGTGTALGGGGIIGGEKGNVLTMTSVVLANNQVTVLGSANIGGGGIQWTGGDMNVTNCTIGGTAVPGAYTDRTSTNTGNLQAGSGGGIMFTPSAPQHTAATGILTVAGTTISRNTAASVGSGGGGADLLVFGFASPGGGGTGSATIGTTTFQNNAANPGNGGAILVESLATTVATTNITNNSAGNRGGGIFVGGASLLLNGATPSITFTGNTATNGGSSVSTSSAVNVDGTNTSIGGDIEINTLGSWTNNAGSQLAPTNVVVTGGTFNMNNSTMNVSGNLTIGPGPVVGSTFNGGTGTVNIQGNFVLNAGGAPATTLNAGTGTFNFNGTGTQSITNGTSITFFNLTDSNITQPLTLNNSLAVNGTLNVNGVNAILSPVAGAVISGTGTLTGTGTARASRIAATPDFLSQYTITNKTLTNLTIDYNGAGNQTVNNTPAYSQLRISGTGIKTLQGNTVITSNLTIAAANLASGNNNFALGGNWTNSVGAGGFTAGTGTVTFQGAAGTQTLTGNTTFFNLTLNNTGATTNFSNTTTTIGNDLVASAGTMDGGSSTIIFTGVTDNAGAISGAAAKNFFNLQINSPATISNTAGANITIENNYTNTGTFSQGAGLTTIFDVDNTADGAHTLSGAGTTTFGNFTINASNTVDAGSHNFNVIGAAFTATGTFTGNTGTVTFNGGVAQSITGNGVKNFGGLLINNANGVSLVNGGQAVDAAVLGILTLNTDLTVAAGAILQQSGTSAGAADVLGTVRRTDLGGVTRSFGNLNNTIQINSGTAPTQLDFNLVKATPTGFPAGVKVVPRTYTLTPTGGAGISATLRLRYIDPTELGGGITESRLVLWKDTTGSDNWVAQGGTVDTAGNHVTHTGISSFSEWAIAEAADLTLSKANNVSGSAVVGQSWNWTLTAANTGSPATFTAGQTIISDNLPNSNITYGTPTVQNVSNITGSANISCSIVSNDLTCTANGGSVTFASDIGASSFDVVFSATAQAVGTYQNPRTGGGIAQIDPNNLIAESNETNNSPANNTVTVGKANTTTAINSDNPDPSVVGQPVTVTWTVAVSAPGALGAPLTGNVTVSDGTDSCTAAVSAGQCDVTFTSAGAKNLTATYAGDSNYNGSASTPPTPHTVNKADTTTTITSDLPDPSTPGQSVTVQWSVTVNSPGAGTPTGNVTVTVSGGAETCSAPVATGQCSLVLNGTGLRTITASYAGDTNFNGSSDTEDHTVCGDSVVTSNADSGAGSLRQIIADACDNSTITFDLAGAGPHTILLTTGELVVNKNLTINNNSGESITISGNNASRVFNINSGKTVSILDLTLTNGRAADGAPGGAGVGGFGEDGGGILNDGSLTLTRVNVTNSRSGDGGSSSTIPGEAGKGGGIYTTGSLTMNSGTVSGNIGGNGGTGGPNPVGASDGGGIYVFTGTANLTGVTITNNTLGTGAGGNGGGMFVRFTTTVTIKSSAITNNSTGGSPGLEGFGGGFAVNGALTVVSSTISGNTSGGPGGGIINQGTGNLTLVNSTVSGNTSNAGSHGISNDSGTTMVLSNCTITNNSPSAGSGFGVQTFGGPAQVGNTIIAGNGGAGGSDTQGAFTSQGNNLIGRIDGGTGFINGVNGDLVGSIALPLNALLGALGNNGGPTETHALLPGSPAIEAGNNTIVAADTLDLDGDLNTSEPIPFDQRGTGFPRILDSADANVIQTVDIGAFEAHPTIEDIANQSTAQDTVKNVVFNLGDDTGSLISTVTATSSNTTLVPNANLLITGSGGSRNLQITPAAGQSGITTITVTVTATNGRTATDTFDLTVTPPNASPVVTTTAGNLAYTENAGPVAIDPGLTVTDADNANLTGATVAITAGFVSAQDTLAFTNQLGITGNYNSGTGVLTLTGTTTVANYQTALRTVTYENSSDNPTASRTITFTATDGISIPGSATRGIAITAVNDAPVNTVPGPQTTNEDTAKVFSSGNGNQISVADVDLGANPIKITLTATNGTLTLATTTGLSFTTGDGTADATMVFTGTLTDVNTAMNGMSFAPTPDFTGPASLQIVSDDQGSTGTGGALTDDDTVAITVTAQNDAPIVTTTAGNLSYTENDPATAIDPGLTVTDADSPNLVGATVAITAGFVSAQDTLAFTNQLGITGNYNSGTGVLTLTGTTTVANYQTALRTVTYQNSSDNPTTSRTVTFTVDDGTSTASASRGITISAVNDPPVNTVPGNQGTAQNTPLVFSSGNSNQVSVADPDAGSNSLEITLTVTNGTLTLSGTTGLIFTVGDGTADATMTFTGSIANINTAMNGMTFTPTMGFSGGASLTITSNDQGFTGSGGALSDTDVVNIQVALDVSIQLTSQVAEPSSGSTNMLFTVTLNAPAPAGGASVDFTTQDQPPALNHATAGQDYTTTSGTINFAQGEQIKVIAVPVLSDSNLSEQNETFLVLLSNPVNATITNGTSTGTILIKNQPGTILISELRTSGPAGAGDDFVEIYNNSEMPHVVNDPSGGYGLFKMGADCSANPILIGVIPNGTTIPTRGHYLFTGSAYSLANYGGTNAAAGDQVLSQDIESDRNVALFSTTSLVNLSTATRLDAAGFGTNTGGVCDLLREGSTLVPLSGSTLQYSYYRDECGKKGNPATFGLCPTAGFVQDSNINSEDFTFVDTEATATPAGQRLGAPGPQNLGSARMTLSVAALLLDATVGAPASPNRLRDTAAFGAFGAGTLTVNRRFQNNTGAPVTRLRFRIVDISSFTSSLGIADVRAISSTEINIPVVNDPATCAATGTPATAPCSVQVLGTTLEEPPVQTKSGALNSSLSAGTITLPSPLAPGASVNLQLKLGVMQTGSFKFFFNIEALP